MTKEEMYTILGWKDMKPDEAIIEE